MVRDVFVSASSILDCEPGGVMLRTLCDVLSGRPVDGLAPVDWSRVAAVAEQDDVASLLCRALDDGGWPDDVPVPVRKRLRRAYFRTAAKNLLIYGELNRILGALRSGAAGTTAVVLKGADLALSIYPSLSLRPMADLDLLVKREHWSSAVHVLEDLGYRRAVPEVAPGHRRVSGNDICLLGGPGDGVLVELHWGLVASDADRRSPRLDWFWSETEAFDGGGGAEEPGDRARVSLPSSFCHFKPTANLLYLTAHIAIQHGTAQSKLLWFYDLHLLISRLGHRVDWDTALEKADELEWSASVFAALERTRDCFGTAIPGGFLETLDSRQNRREKRKLRPNCIQPKGARLWCDMMSLPWRRRFRFAWNHFFPSPAYLCWRYKLRSRWLWPLCYPYRWWVIFSEAMAALRHRATESDRGKSKYDDRLVRALKEVASVQPLRVKIAGDCMAPLARDGDMVEIAPSRLLLPGDVIAFRQQNRLKLHRLIGYRPYLGRLALVTQGDHNISCDRHTDLRDVIGRVSGGECSPLLIRVPLSHRLWALGRFFKLVTKRVHRAVRLA